MGQAQIRAEGWALNLLLGILGWLARRSDVYTEAGKREAAAMQKKKVCYQQKDPH